jgi:hypothetical protein
LTWSSPPPFSSPARCRKIPESLAIGWAHLIASSIGTYLASWNTGADAYTSTTPSFRISLVFLFGFGGRPILAAGRIARPPKPN